MSPSKTPQAAAGVQEDVLCPTNDDLFYSTPKFFQELDKVESLARQTL